MNKAVFLDRDGVLNEDNPKYTYEISNFKILPGVHEGLRMLKKAGYHLIVVTNQSGIAQGLYTEAQMHTCHAYLQEQTGHLIDHIYYCPYHPSVTASLLRKPESLMFEKGMARFNIDPTQSFMVGDRGRDLIPAKKLGIRTIQVGDEVEAENRGEFEVNSLLEAAELILSLSK